MRAYEHWRATRTWHLPTSSTAWSYPMHGPRASRSAYAWSSKGSSGCPFRVAR